MVVHASVPAKFRKKVIQGFKRVIYPQNGEIYYIGGTKILPVPLEGEDEAKAIAMIGTNDEKKRQDTSDRTQLKAGGVYCA